jgi:hypothetical protein
MLSKILLALAFVGAMVVGTPQPSQAQGVYVEGPGVEFGIGPRYHRYHRYDGPYYYRHRWDAPRYRHYHDW